MVDRNSITLRKAKVEDIQILFRVGRQSYSENFAKHWNEGGLEWYLDREYGLERFKSDLNNPDVNYFIAFFQDEAVGFMKVKLNSNLLNHAAVTEMEIEKLYFRKEYQGRGLGKKLMACAFELGREQKIQIIWLGVIDTNERAIKFYQKLGFTFHDKVILDIPYFKGELKGMWRMIFRLSDG